MAVSKRLRYEILRRDNHACRYCGGTAPDTVLTVDHVIPSALGGSDEPTNLVAACKDCNAGKTSTNPDNPLVEDVRADALRWARARDLAAAHIRQRDDERYTAITDVHLHWIGAFDQVFNEWPDVPDDMDGTVGYWLDHGLSVADMCNLITTAVIPKAGGGRIQWRNVWNYFAGCCWTRLRQIDAAAQALLDQGEV